MTLRVLRNAAVTALATTCVLLPATGTAYADDGIRAQQWALDVMRTDEAWRTTKGEGVTVAVLDTGIDVNHPDFAGQIGAQVVGQDHGLRLRVLHVVLPQVGRPESVQAVDRAGDAVSKTRVVRIVACNDNVARARAGGRADATHITHTLPTQLVQRCSG